VPVFKKEWMIKKMLLLARVIRNLKTLGLAVVAVLAMVAFIGTASV
jgi:hypothetical protein